MNKDLLVREVAEATENTQKAVKEVIDATFEIIAKGLLETGEVKVAGFGKFYTSMRAARTGVNPQNPEEKIEIPETRVVKFKPSTNLKAVIKEC